MAPLSAPVRRLLAALGASWFSRILSNVLNLALTPVLFSSLGADELGVWILMMSSIGLLALLDLGLTSTLPRRFAFARGASDIHAAHVDDPAVVARVQDLLVTGNRLYLARIALTLIAGALLGYFVLGALKLDPALEADARIAWAIIVASQAAQLWGAAWTSSLTGFGLSAWQIAIGVAITVTGLVAQIVVASAGYGLIGLAVVIAPLPFIQRRITIGIMRRLHPEIDARRGSWDRALASSMIRPSLLAWVLSISVFATLRLDNFFIAAYLGVEKVAPYFAAMQIYNCIVFLSLAVFSGAVPFLSQRWASGAREDFSRNAIKLIRFSLFMAAAGAGTFVGVGEQLFKIWLGQENYVGFVVVALISGRILLDTLQAAVLGAARSTEFEAFTPLGMTAALLSVVFSFALVPSQGIVGVVAANLIAQGLTLHSFAVARAAKRIGPTAPKAVLRVLLEAIGVAAGCYVAASLASEVLSSSSAQSASFERGVMAFVVALLVAAFALAAVIWFRVFDASDRQLALRLLGGK